MTDSARFKIQRDAIELKIECYEKELRDAKSDGDESRIRDSETNLEAAETELSNLIEWFKK